LIHGKQGYHSHTATANIPHLLQITKDYGAERLWINRNRAEALGIKDGDMVKVKNKYAVGKVRAKVTARLHPEAVYLPSGYGNFSPYFSNAKGFGINQNDFCPYQLEPTNGHAMMMEVIVEVEKA
jgi:thiosulfate reductase/polysulfide reductase chain A